MDVNPAGHYGTWLVNVDLRSQGRWVLRVPSRNLQIPRRVLQIQSRHQYLTNRA